jgi:1-acyl-sn-glycerol-3-phosphate acyltransferase
MKKVLGSILTPIFYFVFGLTLGIFHPIQVICWNLWGYTAHKRSVEIFNLLLIKSLALLGSRVQFQGFDKLPVDRPLIIISNHQSLFDIPPIVWGFRRQHPKFISKKELGHGIPSISYNLRKGGSVLIDRKDPQQAVKQISNLGKKIEKNNYSAVIFPEGTRSRNGKVKKFKVRGIHTLLESAPSSLIVPFVIDGNYKLQENGSFPLAVGVKMTYTVLTPFELDGLSAEEVAEKSELQIREHLGQE